jgi:hypothetical protein
VHSDVYGRGPHFCICHCIGENYPIFVNDLVSASIVRVDLLVLYPIFETDDIYSDIHIL